MTDRISTPWPELDSMIGGLFPGRLYVIGSPPADGKTAMMVALRNFTRDTMRKPALLVELSQPEVVVVPEGVSELDEIKRLNPAIRHTVQAISYVARKLRSQGRLDLLIIDDLHLIELDPPDAPLDQQIGFVAVQFRELARGLGIPVVVTVPVNASARSLHPRDWIASKWEFGDVAYDADAVVLLRQSGDDAGRAELMIGKNRHGRTGMVTIQNPCNATSVLSELRKLESLSKQGASLAESLGSATANLRDAMNAANRLRDSLDGETH